MNLHEETNVHEILSGTFLRVEIKRDLAGADETIFREWFCLVGTEGLPLVWGREEGDTEL